MKTLRYDEIRLVKYTKLIDKAILDHRYGIAIQLAHRCLLEYYRLFLRFLIPNSKYINKNAFQLSMDIVRYVRKQKWTFFKSKQLFAMLTTSYHLTHWSRLKFADRELHTDHAMATFAREQVLAISKLLVGSIEELNENENDEGKWQTR